MGSEQTLIDTVRVCMGLLHALVWCVYTYNSVCVRVWACLAVFFFCTQPDALQGWITKEGGKHKVGVRTRAQAAQPQLIVADLPVRQTWKRRWFVLKKRDGLLFYYKAQDVGDPPRPPAPTTSALLLGWPLTMRALCTGRAPQTDG
jgi:hypothetical protein